MNYLLLAFLLSGCITVHAQSAAEVRKHNKQQKVPRVETGTASYYSSKFQGRRTASGEKYDSAKMTAAHNRLPLGTRVRVTNLYNHRSVIVRVNDRLAYKNKRLIDLSRAAAVKLGYIKRGIAKVKVEVLDD
jgi:rare lipoprotein A